MRFVSISCVLMTSTLFGPLVLFAVESATGESIRLELSLARDETLQCEPAVVEVSIVNDSDEKQWIEGPFDLESKRLVYHIVDPSGKRLAYDPIVHVHGGAAPIPLAPGDRVAVRHMLLYSTTPGQLFRHPGQYSIEVALDGPTENLPRTLRSNAVGLTVRPASGIDAEALEHFGGNPQALFGVGMTRDWAIAREFKWITNSKYPKRHESVYFPWSLYFLANCPPREESDEKKHAEDVLFYSGMLLARCPGFPMALEVRYRMAYQLLRLGRTEEALAQMDELFRAHPNLLLFRRAKEQIEHCQQRGVPISIPSLP